MNRTFTLKLLSTVFVVGTLLCQSAGASQQAQMVARRAANKAQTEAEVREAYTATQKLPKVFQTDVLKVIQEKAVEIPTMTMPGIQIPVGGHAAEYEAIAKTKEFKKLPIEKQNEVLHDLDTTVRARPGAITRGELDASLNAAHIAGPDAARVAGPAIVAIGVVPHGHAMLGMDPGLHANILAIPAVAGLGIADQNRVLAAVQGSITAVPAHGGARDARIRADLGALGIGAIDAAFELAILHEVDTAHPALIADPGMPPGVYAGITGDPAFTALHANVAQQNQVLNAVHGALGAVHANGGARDHAVTVAVNGVHGVPGGLAAAIVNAVNLAHPFVGAPVVLIGDPGMPPGVYAAITGDGAFTALAANVALQNQVLTAIHNAITANPHPKVRRDRRIATRVNLVGIGNPAITNAFIGAMVNHVN